jgi:hypothetical protein
LNRLEILRPQGLIGDSQPVQQGRHPFRLRDDDIYSPKQKLLYTKIYRKSPLTDLVNRLNE